MGRKLEIFLGDVYEIGEAVPTLDGTDFLQVSDDESNLEIVPTKSDINYIKGGIGQDVAVQASTNVNCDLSFKMNVAEGIPQWAKFTQAAGHSVRIEGEKVKIEPIPEAEHHAVIHHYTGTKKDSGAFITKGEAIQFSAKIAANAREIPVLSLTGGMGKYAGEEAGTQPEVTKADIEKYTSVFNPSVSLLGNGYKLLSFEMDMANSLHQEIDAEGDHGFGDAEYEDRETTINLSVYAKTDRVNPQTALLTDTVGDLEIEWGKVNRKINIEAKVQVKERTLTEENGFYKWDLVLAVIDDDYKIEADVYTPATTTTTAEPTTTTSTI